MNPTNSTIERLLAGAEAVNLEGSNPNLRPLEDGPVVIGQITDELTRKLWLRANELDAEVKAAKEKLAASTEPPARAFLSRVLSGRPMSGKEFNESIEKAMNPEPTPEDLALAVKSNEASVLRNLFWLSVYEQVAGSANAKKVGIYGDWQIVLPLEKKAEPKEDECNCPSCTFKRAISVPGLDVRFIRL